MESEGLVTRLGCLDIMLYLHCVKLGHELDVLHHSFVINRHCFQELLKILITHAQFKPPFYGRAELLLSQLTRVLAVNVAEERK